MKANLSLMATATAAALISLAPMTVVRAQAVDADAVVGSHGDYTLKQREDWLGDRLAKARDDGSVDHAEFDRVRQDIDQIRDDEHRMRDHHDGQLTDNETATLESRLDTVADQIHWLHENGFQRPW